MRMKKPDYESSDSLVSAELESIASVLPNLEIYVFARARNYARYGWKTGECLQTVLFLVNLFERYGLSKENLTAFLNENAELVTVNAKVLEDKLAVLNLAGLSERVLFLTPYKLLKTNQLDTNSFFAIIKSCRGCNVEPTYETVFQNYSQLFIEQLKKAYPLDEVRLLRLKKFYYLDVETRKNNSLISTECVQKPSGKLRYSYKLNNN